MKTVILCGGQGTRLREETEFRPKPMVPVGERPILWHIMKIYARYGFKDFVLCLGYKGWIIKEFFLNYNAKVSDISLQLGRKDSIEYHSKNDEADWNITLVETGEASKTARRLWLSRPYLKDCDYISVTYGDGVADINIRKLMEHHQKSGHLVSISGVHPSGRFGEIESEGNLIRRFNEKPNVSAGLINGGFMVFNPEVFGTYINGKTNQSLEDDVLPAMVKEKKVGIHKHPGSWQCVDTPREYAYLNQLWAEDKAFWKIWS